jgi:ribose transport system permease protein
VPVSVAMLAGVVVGALCGLVNGLCVTRLKLPSFIATLGMMLIARGVALQITGARAVSGLGEAFGELGNGSLWRIERDRVARLPRRYFPRHSVPGAADDRARGGCRDRAAAHGLGRHLYAVGSNAEAARLSGVNVNGVDARRLCALRPLSGLTGCVLMSRLVTAQPNEGVMYELDAIASAVIGGTSLTGGIGSISGTMIGAFVIGILRNGLNMNGVSSFVQQIIIGLVILLTVWIDQKRNQKK